MQLLRWCVVACVLVLPLFAAPAGAQSAADSVRIERLAALGRVWGAAKHFHPAFLSRAIDWDSALVAAIPKVRAARDSTEYAAAVGAMLEALGDPETRIAPRREAPPPHGTAARTRVSWTADSTLVITFGDVRDFLGSAQLLGQHRVDVGRASRVVLDVRGLIMATGDGGIGSLLTWSGVEGLLVPGAVRAPGLRYRMHLGFAEQAGPRWGGYWSGSYTREGDVIARSDTTRPPPRVAFIVDENSVIPPLAFALQRSGGGLIVAEGVSRLRPLPEAMTRFPIADGVEVALRVGELADDAGPRHAQPDTVVGAGRASDAALETAVALLAAPIRAAATTAATMSVFTPPAERPYTDMRSPSVEYRLLAAFRYWNAVEYFFPYKDLIGESWKDVLPWAVARFESATDSLSYALAAAGLAARTRDSHAGAWGPVFSEYIGVAGPGFRVRYVEGVPVVVRVSNDSAVVASGIAVGDVITRVDGESVEARRARLTPVIAHSTPQALDLSVAGMLPLGAEGSVAVLGVRGADGGEREVRITRRRAYYPGTLGTWRTGPIIQILPGNIGYADLERLTVPMVDSMFEMLRDTRAVIFDGRGYPRGTWHSIGPRLTAEEQFVTWSSYRVLAMTPDTIYWSRRFHREVLHGSDDWRYLKPTIMLIDEAAISQTEAAGLVFAQANGTTFIGTPTNGTNGSNTNMMLPGGIHASFTGGAVWHADGRQLQRVGIQPHVLVRPTIAGIRAGRDEALEAAVAYIESGRLRRGEPPPASRTGLPGEDAAHGRH